MTKKIVFLGGKNIGSECLRFLFEKSEYLDIDIIGADFPSRDESIKKFSKENNLKLIDGVIPLCDIIISVQYHRILSDIEIKRASKRAVNLHMAPLPEYRGCNQFSFAIMDEVSEFGTTIHEMVSGIDAGPIIAEKRFGVNDNIWVKDLFDLTYNASLELFKKYLPKLISGEYVAVDQSSLLSKKTSSFHLRKEIDDIKRIDLRWSEDKIYKHLRATMMPGFEQPYVIVKNKKIYFTLTSGND